MITIIKIRKVNDKDYIDIREIYSYYISQTAVSFEYFVPSLEEFDNRVKKISSKYPYIVAEDDGQVIGYAYASDPYNDRMACSWDSDVSVYVRADYHGMGVGRRLYAVLEKMLEMLGYVNVYALVTGENKDSCRFHEKVGYTQAGCLPHTGYKMGRWHSIYFYAKLIGDLNKPSYSLPKTTEKMDVYKILEEN